MNIPDFKHKAPLQVEGEAKKTAESNQETVANILTLAVSDHYSEEHNNGQFIENKSTLNGGQGRMWGRIQRKLDDAIDTKAKTIKLDESEVDFLKKAMEGAKFPIQWFRWTVLVEDMLNSFIAGK